MKQLRYVSKREKIFFPLIVLVICILLLPSAAPLIGMLMFGNLLRECGVVERLSDTTQNALINIVTIFLGLGVGSFGLAIMGPKSVKAPTPIKIIKGKMPVSIPTVKT